MLDFAALRNKQTTLVALTADLTVADLRDLTNEMVDSMLGLIAECTDADVVFEPSDPEANDPYAADESESNIPWTLGHVIVHTTASAEEAAALAAELARGVTYRERSRSEVAWQTVTTIDQCRQRLAESRRMRLASLQMWPDVPYLDNTYPSRSSDEGINAVRRFVLGLRHDSGHVPQIAEIVRQAKQSRETAV